MAMETDDKTATISVVGKQFVSITEYKQLLSRASLMERKLKAMENIQDLLRQKDLELRKCRNMIQQYQLALRKSELRRMESMHMIAKISETKDIYGKEQTHEVDDESDQNKGFCLPYTDVNGKSLQKLHGTTMASDVVDVAQSPSVSIVAATSSYRDNCRKTSSAGDSILEEGTELQNSSGMLAINPQKFLHETGTLLKEDSCDQITNLRDERKMELISRSTCLSFKSNQERTNQRQTFQSPLVSSLSKDLLNKLMQQNARLKKALKDILHCKGTSVEHYLDREELSDTIVQLRQRLAESIYQMAELQKKIKTSGDMEQTQNSEDDSNKGGTALIVQHENSLRLKQLPLEDSFMHQSPGFNINLS